MQTTSHVLNHVCFYGKTNWKLSSANYWMMNDDLHKNLSIMDHHQHHIAWRQKKRRVFEIENLFTLLCWLIWSSRELKMLNFSLHSFYIWVCMVNKRELWFFKNVIKFILKEMMLSTSNTKYDYCFLLMSIWIINKLWFL